MLKLTGTYSSQFFETICYIFVRPLQKAWTLYGTSVKLYNFSCSLFYCWYMRFIKSLYGSWYAKKKEFHLRYTVSSKRWKKIVSSKRWKKIVSSKRRKKILSSKRWKKIVPLILIIVPFIFTVPRTYFTIRDDLKSNINFQSEMICNCTLTFHLRWYIVYHNS